MDDPVGDTTAIDHILQLLRGIVRPVVTFVFSGGILWGFLVGLIQPGEFLAIVGPVIGFWFSSRTVAKPVTGSTVTTVTGSGGNPAKSEAI